MRSKLQFTQCNLLQHTVIPLEGLQRMISVLGIMVWCRVLIRKIGLCDRRC